MREAVQYSFIHQRELERINPRRTLRGLGPKGKPKSTAHEEILMCTCIKITQRDVRGLS